MGSVSEWIQRREGKNSLDSTLVLVLWLWRELLVELWSLSSRAPFVLGRRCYAKGASPDSRCSINQTIHPNKCQSPQPVLAISQPTIPTSRRGATSPSKASCPTGSSSLGRPSFGSRPRAACRSSTSCVRG